MRYHELTLSEMERNVSTFIFLSLYKSKHISVPNAIDH